jgi:hypothetical protein
MNDRPIDKPMKEGYNIFNDKDSLALVFSEISNKGIFTKEY